MKNGKKNNKTKKTLK